MWSAVGMNYFRVNKSRLKQIEISTPYLAFFY